MKKIKNFINKFKPYTWRGLWTIGGRDGVEFCISYAGKCVDGWKEFYTRREYKKPWKMWFKNPIFDNRSHYDKLLNKHRVWFIFMWHIVQW